MKFVGRKEELKKLTDLMISDSFGTALIYGRRRVGKSELVNEAVRKSKKTAVVFECQRTTEMNNVNNLRALMSETLDMPEIQFSSLDELLKYFFKTYGNKKVTLVIDEYPYLRETIKGCDSIIQSIIDVNRKKSNCSLILLGSYVETMKSLLEYSNPLYGRFDYKLFLKPMNYLESAEFYPHYSNEDKVRIYSVFGGIPHYNQYVDDSKSVEDNIIELVASNSARLIDEIPEYLQKEIGKMTNANGVFSTLAEGYCKYNDILDQSHVTSDPALAEVLKKLVNMEVVEKVTPINAENNKKKTSYYVYDNLTLFYYRYVYRYRSQMNILNPKDFYKKYIKDDFEQQYVPNRFEYICKEYLILQNKSSKMDPPFFKIGKYYYDLPKEHKNGEFDIVTEDDNGYIFYEVKFKAKPIKNETIQEEMKQVQESGLNAYKYAFISRSGFEKKNVDNVIYIELKDIYKR